jgi:membrane-anchored protein YejM (alkaline phosphatase superfamily)
MANLIYIIDGNNYLCEEHGVSVPTCNHANEFLVKIDNWLEYNASEENKKITAYVVFDSGAKDCSLLSAYAHVEVANNEKADRVILRLARKLKRESQCKVIIISNEHGNEFLTLRKEGFEQEKNSVFAKKIRLGEDKAEAYFDDNLNDEIKSLFGVDNDD